MGKDNTSVAVDEEKMFVCGLVVLLPSRNTCGKKTYCNSKQLVLHPRKMKSIGCYSCDNSKLPFPEEESLPSSMHYYKKQVQLDYKAAKAAELIEVVETLENYRQRLYQELQLRAIQLGTEPEQQKSLIENNAQLRYIEETLQKLQSQLASLAWSMDEEQQRKD